MLYASSGCTISEIIQYSKQHNIGGFEFAIGVPAQLGGAIVNNLGAYNQEISTNIDHITVLKQNQILYLSKEQANFKYHSSNLQNNYGIVLGATFIPPYQDRLITQQKSIEYFTKRKTSQPLNFPNAGSIFKRQQNIIPAKLIDEAGLKGLGVGEAQISAKHAGFIINLGNAKSKDVLTLIDIIQHKVYEKNLIRLELEIEYIGF
jgi:UDP-N-acetylmuramate dehydrogenase